MSVRPGGKHEECFSDDAALKIGLRLDVESNKIIRPVMGGHADNQIHCFNFGFLILAFLIYLVVDRLTLVLLSCW